MRLLLLFLLAAADLPAQTFIDGRVLDSVTGAPVANAYIAWGAGVPGDPMPTTDSAGHFRAQAQNKQVYIVVKHNGYLDCQRDFPVAPGQTAPELRVLLVPQAVITGHVFDENGLPVHGARVAALHYRLVNGKRQLEHWRFGSETNELGAYRIFGMPAGRYYLGFTPQKFADWDPRYNARFYPDAAKAEDAQPVDVKAGEEIAHDFHLSRHEGVTVTGHIARPDAQRGKERSPGLPVHLVLRSTEYSDYSLPVKQAGESFTAAHVPPGTYTLRTWRDTLRPRIGDPIGDLALDVADTDIRDVSLEIRPIAAQDIAGTIVFQGRTKPAPMAVTLSRSLGDSKSAVSNDDGSFVLKGILPGQYHLGVRNASSAGVAQTDGRTITEQLGDRDIEAQMFDIGNDAAGALKITVGAPVAKVIGRLLDAAGQPVNSAIILFLSENHIRSHGFSGADGTFTANLLAPGRQHIFIVTADEELDDVRNPDFLKAHGDDFPVVQIAAGANVPLVLRMKAQ
jgi:hypothetical protein